MKKLISFLGILISVISAIAQIPQRMSYQAVIRNSSGQLVDNEQVGIRFSILQGSVSGTAVYIETQTPTTNSNGLVSLQIGEGTQVSGDISNIDWSSGQYFIKTEIDPNFSGHLGSYTIIVISQLLSVPYAFYAETIPDGSVTSAKIADNTIDNKDLASGSVNSSKIVDGTISKDDLADGSVTSGKIADGTISTVDLADGIVTTAKLANGKVDNASWADNAAKINGLEIFIKCGNNGTVSGLIFCQDSQYNGKSGNCIAVIRGDGVVFGINDPPGLSDLAYCCLCVSY